MTDITEKPITLAQVISWIGSAVMILLALASVKDSLAGSALLTVAAALLWPPVRERLRGRLGALTSFAPAASILLALQGMVLAGDAHSKSPLGQREAKERAVADAAKVRQQQFAAAVPTTQPMTKQQAGVKEQARIDGVSEGSPEPAHSDGRSFFDPLRGVTNKVAADAVAQYNIAAREGDRIQICVQAGMVSAAYLQAQDETNYRHWKAIEKADCRRAGMPQ